MAQQKDLCNAWETESTASDLTSVSPRNSSNHAALRPVWADLADSDGEDASSDPWLVPSTATPEPEIQSTLPKRKVKIVNKKLTDVPGRMGLVKPFKESEQTDLVQPTMMAVQPDTSNPPSDGMGVTALEPAAAAAEPDGVEPSCDQGVACKQCIFFFTPFGCLMGDACNFCHLEHAHQGNKRPSKAKRDRYRKLFAARAKVANIEA